MVVWGVNILRLVGVENVECMADEMKKLLDESFEVPNPVPAESSSSALYRCIMKDRVYTLTTSCVHTFRGRRTRPVPPTAKSQKKSVPKLRHRKVYELLYWKGCEPLL